MKSNFITEIIDNDIATGKHKTVVTRFPPEPNGYLHIGHAKSICLNFGLARDYGTERGETGDKALEFARCHLRFDDTNPVKEDPEFVESIQADVRWLGFDWDGHLYHASDYFERMYALAQKLIREKKAYVCSLTPEKIRETRGTVTEPGTPSPYRDRPIEESLELLERMRRGEFEVGEHVVRLNIDMANANMKMRDPLIYRIKNVPHDRTGDAWNIYPLYDYAHCLSDSFEKITHSICTLEFENNRELYDWILDACDEPQPRPKQYEFARLFLNYTVMSKRKLLQLVEEEIVDGWDDPRMPTIAGLRRRGYTPESIRMFAERVGVAKNNSVVDVSLLEWAIRQDLEPKVGRGLAVLDPLEVVIDNWNESEAFWRDVPVYPQDSTKNETRKLPFSGRLYIERSDFAMKPPKRFHRLAPGREVRLRNAFFIKFVSVETDESGHPIRVHCTYDPETLGGSAPDGRKVTGTLHWVSADLAVPAEFRIYDRLFSHESPGSDDRDFKDDLNPSSLRVVKGWVEPALKDISAGAHVQLERLGYFYTDPIDHSTESIVFNRTVALKDAWANTTKQAPKKGDRAKARKAQASSIKRADVVLSDAAAALKATHGLSDDEARLLTDDEKLHEFFGQSLGHGGSPRGVAKWIVNELLRVTKDTPLTEVRATPTAIGQLVALLEHGEITQTAAKVVFEVLLSAGGNPKAIVNEKGLAQQRDESVLEATLGAILEEHADLAASYRAGEKKLFGFFIGQAMRATRGQADAKLVRSVLMRLLDD
jgi:glutaminyl-tRNA synthetase